MRNTKKSTGFFSPRNRGTHIMLKHFFLTTILSLCLGKMGFTQCDDLVLLSPLELEFCEGDEINAKCRVAWRRNRYLE